MLISRFLLGRAGQGADQAEKEDNKKQNTLGAESDLTVFRSTNMAIRWDKLSRFWRRLSRQAKS